MHARTAILSAVAAAVTVVVANQGPFASRAEAAAQVVRCESQDKSGEIDAMRVDLQHRCGSVVKFFVPYTRTADGYTFERPFTP